ncbi:hypothetical protein E2562_008756 [Oryza meyeriana var. granulata]|uniref:Uncharacterized protein n=1 Tax=Oryza meyeriana var. granulata TaxID=110450 RepID=A0A6G1D0I0_9ORYZ|nr:hypothetical protein E2562_008756 [Oryza meyeriana var. granulata]
MPASSPVHCCGLDLPVPGLACPAPILDRLGPMQRSRPPPRAPRAPVEVAVAPRRFARRHVRRGRLTSVPTSGSSSTQVAYIR